MKSFDVDINELPPNKMRVLFSKNNLGHSICRSGSFGIMHENERSFVKIEHPKRPSTFEICFKIVNRPF